MDILFKNNFTLTLELLLECRVAFTKKLSKYLLILGLIMCLFSFIYFYSESTFKDKINFILFFIFFSYMLLILPTVKVKRMYKQYLSINNYKEPQESINFYNDMFEIISPTGGKVSLSYERIKKIYNKNKMLVFLSKENMLVFIKKDAFEQGTYDDFKTFIYSKTNLSF